MFRTVPAATFAAIAVAQPARAAYAFDVEFETSKQSWRANNLAAP